MWISQHCLLLPIEKFKEALDAGRKFGVLLTEFSKAFDCLDHSLLVANYIGMNFHPYLLSLHSPTSATIPIAPK